MTSMISQKVFEMERIGTRTLYEMVTAWTEQPWDGTQYYRITEELWNSVDASGLMDGPYGDSVTLLEMCIVDFTETLQAGQLTEEQAVDGLKKLLEIDDFVEGARIIEVCVKTNPVCRISNIDNLLQLSQTRAPLIWTRGMKIGFVVSLVTILGIYLVLIGLQLLEPFQSLSWLVIASVSGFFFYYLSQRNSPTFDRVMWPLGYACIFAMGWFILVIPLGPIIGSIFSPSPYISYQFFAVFMFWIGLGSCMLIGGILGDRQGKKRNYMPYTL